jgi:hypothetical protein
MMNSFASGQRGTIVGSTFRCSATISAGECLSHPESQRLFRRRQKTGVAQECVVEVAGLEPATKRLWTVDDSLRGTRRVSARTPASIADATMRPVLEQAGDTDSARQATIDSGQTCRSM